MAKVCILASVFWPIYPGFGGRHAYVLAENLAKAGYEVNVVAAFPIDLRKKGNFFRQRLISVENLNGIKIYRVPSLLPTGLGLIRKALFYASFMLTSLLAIPFIKRADFVLGLHPPPAFLLFPGLIFSRMLRAKYIIRVTDLWPDVVFEFKLARSAPLKQIVALIAKLTYGLADHIMAFTPEIRNRMLQAGIAEKKISIVEMAVNTQVFAPTVCTVDDAMELCLPNPRNRFVVLYAGAFALTYDFETLLEAARELQGEDILFVILGDGDAKEYIVNTIKRYNLTNVIMPPPVASPDKVAKYIGYSDVCIMPLKSEMVTSTLTRPSKIFEFWSCAKPVISCTRGEVAVLTNESGAGIIVEPGDIKGLTESIQYLYRNPAIMSEMGAKARDYVVSKFSYHTLRESLMDTFSRCN